MDRLFLINFYNKIGKFPSVAITFLLTIIGWVIFRASSIEQIIFYLKSMFRFDFAESYYINNQVTTIYIIGFIFAFITLFKVGLKIENFFFFKTKHSNIQLITFFALVLVLFIISTASIVSSGFNPFIYFRF